MARREVISFRVSPRELQRIDDRADELDLTRSEFAYDRVIAAVNVDPPKLTTKQRRRYRTRRIRKAIRSRKQLEAPADLMPLIELALSLLYDIIEQAADDLDSIELWASEGGVPPRSLTDPVAAVPVIAEIRQLITALATNQLTAAMTASEVIGLMERVGNMTRRVVGEVLRDQPQLNPAAADDIAGKIYELCADGWQSLAAGS